jgi:uncharacterized protein
MGRPFVVNVRNALRQPGTQHRLTPRGTLSGIALSSSRVPGDAEVRTDLTMEAQGATVIVRGTVEAPWVGECRRCLTETGGDVRAEVHEVFEEAPVEGETFPLTGDQIDLAPMLREVLALNLPVAPLCREDCAGPDPDAHPVGVPPEADPDAADVGEPPRDPRWAVLDQLRVER